MVVRLHIYTKEYYTTRKDPGKIKVRRQTPLAERARISHHSETNLESYECSEIKISVHINTCILLVIISSRLYMSSNIWTNFAVLTCTARISTGRRAVGDLYPLFR